MKYLLCFLMNYVCCSDSTFYNIITNNLSNCHISINVCSNDYFLGKAVVQNHLLFQYLSEKEGFGKEQYKQFIIPIITGNIAIKMDSTDFKKFDFDKVNRVESVQKLSKEGITNFLKYYFTNINDKRMLSICNKSMDHLEQTAVINVLYDWKIPSFIDDETGYLMIIRCKE